MRDNNCSGRSQSPVESKDRPQEQIATPIIVHYKIIFRIFLNSENTLKLINFNNLKKIVDN